MRRYLLLGTGYAATYAGPMEHVIRGELRLGPSIAAGDVEFRVPADYPLVGAGCREDGTGRYVRVTAVRWLTNMRHGGGRPLPPLSTWGENTARGVSYPRMDNHDAVSVGRTRDIPSDYDGVMGVPVTYLDKHDPARFEILGQVARPVVGGRSIYRRILIRRVHG